MAFLFAGEPFTRGKGVSLHLRVMLILVFMWDYLMGR